MMRLYFGGIEPRAARMRECGSEARKNVGKYHDVLLCWLLLYRTVVSHNDGETSPLAMWNSSKRPVLRNLALQSFRGRKDFSVSYFPLANVCRAVS